MRKIIEDIYCGRFSAVNRPIERGSEIRYNKLRKKE